MMNIFNSKGFTLLEILVVFSVAAVLAGGGFASFVSYSKKQVLDQAVADIKTGIDQAKFNAVSRVKPTVSPCSTSTPLSKYRIKVCSSAVSCNSSSNLYEIDAACIVNNIPTWTGVLNSKKRASALTATVSSAECGATSGTVMQFSVLNGIDAPCRIVLTDTSTTRSKTICVDGGGNTSIKDGSVTCGAAYLATTPIPTSPPITLIPTPTTLPDPPSIKSQSVTNITATSATLNSTVNPNRGTTTITYRWDISNKACSSLVQALVGPSINGSTDVSPNATNLPGLTGNFTYYFCTTADNTAAGGGLTEGVNDNKASLPFLTVPNAPTGVSAGSPTQTSLTVFWTAPAGGVGWYDLFYCDRTSSGSCTPSTKVNASNISSGVTSYLHNTGITCGRTYAYAVKGVNNTGSSANSNIATGATLSCATPTPTITPTPTNTPTPTPSPTPVCTYGYKDNDLDGYYGGTYGCYTGAVSATSNDCDDTSAVVNPGSNTYRTTPISSTGPKNGTYDYNCNNLEEKQYAGTTNYPFICTTACSSGNTAGWQGSPPGCGGSGTYSYGCKKFSDTSCNVAVGGASSTCSGSTACYSADYLYYGQGCR